MKTAKEFWISKFPDAKKDWQKTGHDDNFQVRMMEEYAKYYHEQHVNSVDLADVVGSLPSDETIWEAADKWVFEDNGMKWSNNDNTGPDNHKSFRSGCKWVLDLLRQ